MSYKTISEVLKDAIKIEENSYWFYKDAKKVLVGVSVEGGKLLDQLAKEELRHKALISQLDVGEVKKVYVNYEPDVSRFESAMRRPIQPKMSPKEIRELAIQREQYTRDFYMSYADAVSVKKAKDLFITLAEFESQHIHKIKFEFGGYYGI